MLKNRSAMISVGGDKMEFIKCTHDEVSDFKKHYGLKLSWACDYPYKIEIDGIVVALIDYSIGGPFGEDSLEIESFEVFEKGKGFGSEIIKEILKEFENRAVALYPENKRCMKFWKYHGFEIVDEGGDVEKLVFNKNL